MDALYFCPIFLDLRKTCLLKECIDLHQLDRPILQIVIPLNHKISPVVCHSDGFDGWKEKNGHGAVKGINSSKQDKCYKMLDRERFYKSIWIPSISETE
jgi:hypothetical protein